MGGSREEKNPHGNLPLLWGRLDEPNALIHVEHAPVPIAMRRTWMWWSDAGLSRLAPDVTAPLHMSDTTARTLGSS